MDDPYPSPLDREGGCWYGRFSDDRLLLGVAGLVASRRQETRIP
jgi:hypothetical protein